MKAKDQAAKWKRRGGERYKGIQRKEQTATALLDLTRLSVCLYYHCRCCELKAKQQQGSRKEKQENEVRERHNVIVKTEREIDCYQLQKIIIIKNYAGTKNVI